MENRRRAYRGEYTDIGAGHVYRVLGRIAATKQVLVTVSRDEGREVYAQVHASDLARTIDELYAALGRPLRERIPAAHWAADAVLAHREADPLIELYIALNY